MNTQPADNRTFAIIFTAAAAVHLLLLLTPVIRQQAPTSDIRPAVKVRLEQPSLEPRIEEPLVEPIGQIPVEPVELAKLPATKPRLPAPSQPPEEESSITAQRILSDLRARQRLSPLDPPAWEYKPVRPDYYVRHQSVLEEVLNKPSLQLPFKDTRIYLVDSYDPGIPGSVQRFFDEATVPFGFTTKNNTRVQCAWILVIAGCSWGDVSYYYAKNKARKNKSQHNRL